MIGDLDEALKRLLLRELKMKSGEMSVEFDTPNRKWSAALTKPTLNLFLYDVRENVDLKDTQPIVTPGENGQVAQKRPPLRVDAAYLVTAWAGEPADEHRLLARALMALARHPALPADLADDGLSESGYPLPMRLRPPDEQVKATDLWGVLDNDLRPALNLVVTVPLDAFAPVSGPAVRSKTIRTAPVFAQERAPADGEIVQIAGTVTRKGKPEQPVAGASVAVRGTGLRVTTGADGRFTFRSVPPGEQVLVVTPPGQKAREKAVQVPGDDYDLEV